MPPPPPTFTFDDAITDLRTYAGGLFETAYYNVSHPPAEPTTPPTSAAQAAEQVAAKALARWQGQMTTALKQLDQAEELAAKQQGRLAYAKIAATAVSVCTQIQSVVAMATSDPDANARLSALSEILTGLAALAPAEVWQQATGGNGNNGGA